jgi:hypothetical protein
MKKLLFAISAIALVASAADTTYKFTLQETATLNGTQLKPGDYKVQVSGDKATLKIGKTVIEAPVKVETADKKFSSTSIDINTVNNQPQISEIHVGGTTAKLVFAGGATAGQ